MHCFRVVNSDLMARLIYSEEATKFEEISQFYLTLLSNVRTVAFSEYANFNKAKKNLVCSPEMALFLKNIFQLKI